MYLVEIKKLKDEEIYKKIYTDIDLLNISKHIYITYEFDFNENLELPKYIQAHMYIVNINQILKYSEDELEDLILDLIEFNKTIVLKNLEEIDPDESNKEKIKILKEIIEDFGLEYFKYETYNFDKKIDLKNPDYVTYQIVLEFLDAPDLDEPVYGLKTFFKRFTINKEGILKFENEKICDLNKDSILKIVNYTNDKIEENFKEVLKERENVINTNWYEPLTYIIEGKKANEKILNYKKRVFEKIKNIPPERYPEINYEIISKFNMAGYIMLKDIKNILKGDNDEI